MNEISSDLYKELLDRMSDGVYFVDQDRKILYWNEGATRLTGYKPEEITGLYCQDNMLCHVDAEGNQLCYSGCPLSDCLEGGVEHEAEIFLRHKQGRRVPVDVRVQAIRGADGKIIGAVEIFRDSTPQIEVRRKAEALERLAFLDPLTQQPNRRFLEMSLRKDLSEYQATGRPFGVLLFDLNEFKAINDRFGHGSGDRALQQVAKTLAGALRAADVVGRWGGDEFLAIVRNVSLAVLGELAQRCTALVQEASYRNDDGALESLSISVGAALIKPGDGLDRLIARADGRMYKRKKDGPKLRNTVLPDGPATRGAVTS